MDDANPQLLRLALAYTNERARSGSITASTAKQIRYVLTDFARSTTVAPKQVNRRHVERWLDGKAALATKRRSLSMLRGFCEWCVFNGHMRSDPSRRVEAPRKPRSAPRALTQEAAERIVATAGGSTHTTRPDARGAAVVLLMLQEGLRCAEVASAELGDVDLERLSIAVRGKGGRQEITRTVPLSAESAEAIRAYLSERPATAGPLFRSYTTGKPLTPNYLSQLLSRWLLAAGIKERPRDGRSGHALRHTAASHALAGGADLRQVQHMLGHLSIRTTEAYVSGVTPELREAMGGRSYRKPA